MADDRDPLTTALADRYAIERELGAGGMATVYLAEDLKHRRKVALKVLRPELALAIGPERFLREIETTAGLHHPHVLALYDSGTADGFLYYVMPYVEGESLRDRLVREKQLPLDDALQIAREVADALSYAHSRGVIHRDIKPENILLASGHAVVADFGIAKAVSAAGGETLTQTGMVVGTPQYMSPEQAAGDQDLDGRSDLYSLACVLYEMLAGQPPFTGPTVESVVHQHLAVEPRAITQIRPAVPAEVADAIQRALAKTRADRFNPVAQFSDALRAAAMSTSATVSAATRTVRSPLRLGLIVAGGLAVLAAAWLGGRTLMRAGGASHYERIAVLPLDNQTGDSGQVFFANGMTREIIGVLTDAGVHVLGHRAVASYRNATLPLSQIAKDLRVDAIVTGTVLQAGDVVQVAVELIDPSTDESLWAHTLSRPAPEVITLQHQIALEIAQGIHARLTPDQERYLGTARPVDPKAYAQYLLGQEQLNQRRPETIRRSIGHLQRSLTLDSTFGPAWATLALANAIGAFYGAVPPDSGRAATERAANHALAIDSILGDAMVARGTIRWVVDWDFTAADEDLRRGVAHNPTTLAQEFYSYFPWAMGQFEEAIRVGQRVVDLEPTTAQWRNDLAWDRWAAGDSAGARASALRAVALDSTYVESYFLLSLIDADGGDIAAARRWTARRNRMGGDSTGATILEGYTMARAGDTAGAYRAQRALERSGELASAALLLAALDDKDAMYATFERAIDAREPYALWSLNAVPWLRKWRHEPRYQTLLARMGLPEEWRR
jgi:TolB-like protein